MRLQYSDASRKEWMSSMTQAAASLSRLKKLALDCSSERGADWARIKSAALLSNVLRNTQRLRVLRLCCHGFTLEAPLQSLQHLLLSVGGGAADMDLSMLALAPNLVTVRVINGYRTRARIVPEHLDLRPLSRLTAVCLDYIVPAQLSLPQQCSLAVQVDKLELARAEVWDSVHSHIRSFTIRSCTEVMRVMTDLPAVLLREPPLRQVALRFQSFGTAELPLQLSKALVQATSLKLRSEQGMYLLVPDEASCQQLLITAPQQLQWEWLSANGRRTSWHYENAPFDSFSIKFGSLLGTGFLEMLQACPRQDTQHQFRREEAAHICMTKPGIPDQWCYQWECCCGACELCLWDIWCESIWP